MLSLFPSSMLFISCVVLGTLVSLSSSQGLFVWAGLEINLLSFVPIIMQSSLNREAESAVKYFLVQAIGSGFILLGFLGVYLMYEGVGWGGMIYGYITGVGLLIKMGAAPFHFWFPQVMSGMSWVLCLVLTTWQKVAPVFLVSSLGIGNYWCFVVVALFSSMVGGIGGLNQTQLRALLAYSSIGHMGWVIISVILSSEVVYVYFFIYSIIMVGLMGSLALLGVTLRSLTCLSYLTPLSMAMIGVMLLSLGGLPPFLGFLPKWLVMEHLLSNGLLWVTLVLLFGSLMNLFYYISVVFNSFFSFYSVVAVSSVSSRINLFIVFSVVSSFSLGIGGLILLLFALALFY